MTALPELSEIWVSTFGHFVVRRGIGCQANRLPNWVVKARRRGIPTWDPARSLVVAPASNLGENYGIVDCRCL